MHKLNRIGTPNFYTPSTAATPWDQVTPALNRVDLTNANFPMNIVNASPVQDYGSTPINMAASTPISPAGGLWSIAQQFTIPSTPGSDNNAYAVELGISLQGVMKDNIQLRHFVIRMDAATSTPFASHTTANIPKLLSPLEPVQGATGTFQGRSFWSLSRVLINTDDPETLPGSYAHGLLFLDTTSAAVISGRYKGFFDMRTLNAYDRLKPFDPQR